MDVRPVTAWTGAERLSVARLIVEPGSNGGQAAPVSADDVAAQLSGSPAVAVFEGSRAVFVAGLWPFDASVPRGILHVAGTGEQRDAYQIVAAFLGALPGVEVLTFTDRPALARLARRVGLEAVGEQEGYTVLRRASRDQM